MLVLIGCGCVIVVVVGFIVYTLWCDYSFVLLLLVVSSFVVDKVAYLLGVLCCLSFFFLCVCVNARPCTSPASPRCCVGAE